MPVAVMGLPACCRFLAKKLRRSSGKITANDNNRIASLMKITLETLEPGDIVEIKYRVWRPTGDGSEEVVERWTGGLVVAREPGTRPLLRLADGQMTELRPFMTWRLVCPARHAKEIAA